MTPALLGKKVGMTRIYDDKGAIVPVTVVQCEPNAVTQIKTPENDGYHGVQLGYREIKPKFSNFPLIGHAAKAGLSPRKYFKEVKLKAASELTLGAEVKVDSFADVKFVDVIGVSKGKGFAGVMKRHHFGGQPASHGTERKHRSPGSIASHGTNRGNCGKPKKGLRMGGHMGDAQITTRNHHLVKIDSDNNLLLIKGCLPGANGALVFIRKSITAKVKAEA